MQVVQQGALGVDGEGEDLSTARCDRDLAFLIGQRLRLEELRDALPAFDLDQQSAFALGGEGKREGRGDRGLAGSALAADDMEPAHDLEPNQSPRGLRTRLSV
ncbi:hypothetical protein GCM10020000_37720 [Streptomyces olivoverticillatus]